MKSHLKRLRAPKTWPILKKAQTFITRTAGSGSSMLFSIPIVIAFKDMLGLAETTKEVKHILHDYEVFVDGKRVRNHDASIPLLGTVSIPAQKTYYRLTISTKNILTLIPITSEEGNIRPCRVEAKTLTSKGLQLNCSGGNNILVKKDEYKIGGTILIDLAKKTITQYFAFEKGMSVLLYKGTHVGHFAIVENVDGKQVTLKADDGSEFETRKEYCIIVGKGKPAFKLV